MGAWVVGLNFPACLHEAHFLIKLVFVTKLIASAMVKRIFSFLILLLNSFLVPLLHLVIHIGQLFQSISTIRGIVSCFVGGYWSICSLIFCLCIGRWIVQTLLYIVFSFRIDILLQIVVLKRPVFHFNRAFACVITMEGSQIGLNGISSVLRWNRLIAFRLRYLIKVQPFYSFSVFWITSLRGLIMSTPMALAFKMGIWCTVIQWLCFFTGFGDVFELCWLLVILFIGWRASFALFMAHWSI